MRKFMLPPLPLPPIEELKLTWMWMDMESAMAEHHWGYGFRISGYWLLPGESLVVTQKRWVME